MYHLISKTKANIYKIKSSNIENDIIYSFPKELEDTDGIPYNISTTLNSDEWFVISNFKNSKYSIDLIKEGCSTTKFNQIPKNEYENIEWICSCQDNDFYFQKIYKKNMFKKASFLSFSKEPEIKNYNSLIMINNVPDVIYYAEKDALYFKKLFFVDLIFNNVTDFLQEASDDKVKDFLGYGYIELNLIKLKKDEQYNEKSNIQKVTSTNRKLITAVLTKIKKFSEDDKKEIFRYTLEYNDNGKLNFKDGKFIIESNEQFKRLLYGLEERYYETPRTNEKRIANSIRLCD